MPKYEDNKKQLKCSFCGKAQEQVKRLVAGPGVYICDECVGLCNEIIGEEFDVALIGKKGKWYDHKVVVFNPQPLDSTDTSIVNVKETQIDLEDGSYAIDIIFEGGSGKAEILSPAIITVSDNALIATLKWSSSNYDYMIVGDEKYQQGVSRCSGA